MSTSILLTVLLPLTVLAQNGKPANEGYNGGEDNPQDPTDAGAAGASKGDFTLSKGAMAAIIVVAVLVAVLGTASAILFYLAKKRQWDVRQSIRRASRRMTGRSTADLSKRQNRRTGVRLNSPPPSKRTGQNRDLEKGISDGAKRGQTTTTITSTFDVEDKAASKGKK